MNKSTNNNSDNLATTVQEIVNNRIKESGSAKAVNGNDFISQIIKTTVETLMQAEMEEHLQETESNTRNGRGKKTIKGDFGQIEIETPRDRDSSFRPDILPKRQKELGDFSNKVVSLYARGLTTREIQEHLYEMYKVEVSPQFVSMATGKLKEQLEEWRNRPLEKVYPVVFVDGTFVSVRDDETGIVSKKCLYVVLAIDLEGRLDVLSLEIEKTEGARFWLNILGKLQKRGVEDILIVCADGLKGFSEALEATFPKADLQLCVVHHIRNVTRFVKHKDKKEFCADMKNIYAAPDIQAAEFALEKLEEKWGKKYPASITPWKEHWQSLTTFFKYPVELRKLIYTTNRIENLNSRIKKNIKNRRQFRNDESLLKIAYLNVRNVSQKWAPVNNWCSIYHQLVILFGDRVKISQQ